MKNGSEYFKWSVILIIFIVVVLLLRGCFCNKGNQPSPPPKQTEKVDTFFKEGKTDTVYVPIPVKTIKPKTITLHDTLEFTEYKDVDSLAILKDYLSINIYSDVQKVEHGEITINDTVTQNKIVRRGILTNFKIPEVVKTVTITEKYPRKVVLFVGGGLVGNQQTPFFGAEGNISLQFKNLKTYTIGYMLNKTNDPLYSFRFSLPIRLGKH